jgi:hypothetical protein
VPGAGVRGIPVGEEDLAEELERLSPHGKLTGLVADGQDLLPSSWRARQ